MAECEAVLLGREAIDGSVNATALASLVKSLLRKPELHRKYILCCTCERGLQMIPYRRLEDEGFESDEDLTSLGSCDSSSSVYVSDHAVRSTSYRCNTSATGRDATTASHAPPSSHTSSGTQPSNGSGGSGSGSVSSIGTDSANSSGASDNDEADTALSHNVNRDGNTKPFDCVEKKKRNADEVENFAFREIAFCHTDPSLQKIIVWVVKTKRLSKITNEYSYGLEAIVFLCHSEHKFRALYKSFQEFSRRQKLEKPIRSGRKDEGLDPGVLKRVEATSRPSFQGGVSSKAQNKCNAVVFNLVQRVDTDGVTHIEVTRPGVQGKQQPRVLSGRERSSIISINTPDSGDVKAVSANKCGKLIDGVIETDEVGAPPERPERKKGSRRTSSKDAGSQRNRDKVVRGQFVRVTVDQKTLSSPASRGGWLFSEAKPCGNVLSYPSSLVWYRNEEENEQQSTERKSRKEAERSQRYRSRSSGVLRRAESPKRYPVSREYIDAIHLNNSLPNRFFGRLKELTGASLPPKFKRRNSIGDMTKPNYYHQEGAEREYEKNHVLTKSTPNLKSMIKNKNGKYHRKGYIENEPKKVTFSAYATVQVVD